jgi:hypothetical protein
MDELTLPETPAILEKALIRYGHDAQILQCVEELNELAVELMHYRKQPPSMDYSHIQIDEIADVLICAMSMRHIFGASRVDALIQQKLRRLEERMK